MLIEAFIADAPVEALDKRILIRLPRLDVEEVHAVLHGPPHDRPADGECPEFS
jgi:hypothetical protein